MRNKHTLAAKQVEPWGFYVWHKMQRRAQWSKSEASVRSRVRDRNKLREKSQKGAQERKVKAII